MKGFIKKLLRESLINEVYFMQHSNDRIKERIKIFSDDDIPASVKHHIYDNIDILHDIDLNPKKSYGVMIGSFNPDKDSPHYVGVRGRGYYSIIDDTVISDSTGNQFWVIVRGNKATTVMLRKEIQTKDVEHNKQKLNVDVIIKDLPKFYKERQEGSNKTQKKETFKKYKLPSGDVVRYYADSNRFETLQGTPIEMDDIFDSLPEDMQTKVLSNLD